MKTVRLPIYDENGILQRDYLEITIEFFDRLMVNARIWPGSVKIVTPPLDEATKKFIERFRVQEENDRKAAEELDKLNRIVHDLPARPDLSGKTVVYKKQKVDSPPHYSDWRKIPGFSRYTMNPTKKIIEDSTDLEVPVTLGRLNNVLLTNDDGVMKRMSVNHIFQQTFPELAYG